MRKNGLIVIGLLTMSLISCSPKNLPSSESNSEEINLNDDLGWSALSEDEKIEKVYDYLLEANKTMNYTISYKNNGIEKTDIYTQKYISYTDDKNGYVKLESYDTKQTEKKNIIYQYELEDDKIHVLNSLQGKSNSGNKIGLSSFVSLNPLCYNFAVISKNDMSIDHSNGRLTSNDTEHYLPQFFALLSKDSNFKSFTNVSISINSKNELIFITENRSYQITGKLYNVGNSVDSKLDMALTTYKLPDESVNKSTFDKLFSSKSSYHNVTNIINDSDNKTEWFSSNDFTRGSDSAINILSTAKGLEKTYYFNANQTLCYAYIDGKNESQYVSTGYRYSDNIIPYAKISSLNSFRKISDNRYQYFGIYAEEMFQAFSFMYGNLQNFTIKTIEIDTNEEDSPKIITTFLPYITDEKTYHVEVTTTLNSYVEPVEPTQLNPNEATSKVQNGLDKLNGKVSYKATIKDYKLVDDKYEEEKSHNLFYLDSKNKAILIEQENKFTGLKYQDSVNNRKGIVPFKVNSKNELISTNYPYNTDSLMGFLYSINANILIEKDGYYVVSQDVKYFENNMAFGPYKSYLLPNTFKITHLSDGTFVKFEYDYYYKNTGVPYYGKEEITFDYSNFTLPNNIDLSKKVSDFIEPKTWREENLEIYSNLISVFNEKIANVVDNMYVFNQDIHNKWFTSMQSGSYVSIFTYSSLVDNNLYEAMSRAIVDEKTGFAYTQSNGDGTVRVFDSKTSDERFTKPIRILLGYNKSYFLMQIGYIVNE